MYRKVLVGYDDSDGARDALTLGRQLAEAAGAEAEDPAEALAEAGGAVTPRGIQDKTAT
jgi:hypothetical protein